MRQLRKGVRTIWDEENEEWYYSIVDVVGVLAESRDARKYWNKLKQRLKEEGSELVTNCHQLKLKSVKDGKRYVTDVANTEQFLCFSVLYKIRKYLNKAGC